MQVCCAEETGRRPVPQVPAAEQNMLSAPNIEGYAMAVRRGEELLLRVTQALEAADVTYAVIGGHAVAAWVAAVDESAVRATKDVDILLRPADLDAAAAALATVGLKHEQAWGLHMFLDAARPNPRTGVHVVLAGTHVVPQDRYPAPDPVSDGHAAAGFRVLALAPLVAMKLQAGRPVDQTHVEDLLEFDLVDAQVRAVLPPDLRVRLDEWTTDWRQRRRPGRSPERA